MLDIPHYAYRVEINNTDVLDTKRVEEYDVTRDAATGKESKTFYCNDVGFGGSNDDMVEAAAKLYRNKHGWAN